MKCKNKLLGLLLLFSFFLLFSFTEKVSAENVPFILQSGNSASRNLSDSDDYIMGRNILHISYDQSDYIYLPDGILTRVVFGCRYIGVNVTDEIATIYIGVNSSFTEIGTTTFPNEPLNFSKNYTDLNISVTNDDYIQLKLVTPSWGSNPSAVYCNASYFVETTATETAQNFYNGFSGGEIFIIFLLLILTTQGFFYLLKDFIYN